MGVCIHVTAPLVGVSKVYRLRRSRYKLNAKKTIAHDGVTYGTTACKILKKINGLATRIELTLWISMPLPWNILRNSTIHFNICSYSVTYLLRVMVSQLWRSQSWNISSLFTQPEGNGGKTRRRMASDWLSELLAVKMIRQQISLTNRLAQQSTTPANERRQWRIRAKPPIMRELDIHRNIPVSVTKLTLGLQLDRGQTLPS